MFFYRDKLGTLEFISQTLKRKALKPDVLLELYNEDLAVDDLRYVQTENEDLSVETLR